MDELLSFEPKRARTEHAVTAMGLAVVDCFLVAGKARDICAHYHSRIGDVREIVITCVPGMTQQDVYEEVRRAINEPVP